MDLQNRVGTWAAAQPLIAVGTGSADRTSIEFHLKIVTPPPLTDLSLILGDAIHAYRSALDAALWEVGHVDGRVPSDPRSIQFPVAKTGSSWRDAKSKIDVESEFLDRIQHLQPFAESVEEGTHGLGLLHDLDIRDKHKSSIVAVPQPLDASIASSLYLEAGQQVWLEMNPDPSTLEEGAWIGTLRTDRVLRDEDLRGRGVVQAMFMVETGDARIELNNLLSLFSCTAVNGIRSLYGLPVEIEMTAITQQSPGEPVGYTMRAFRIGPEDRSDTPAGS